MAKKPTVLVVFSKHWGNYNGGETAAFGAAKAKDLVDSHMAVYKEKAKPKPEPKPKPKPKSKDK